MHTHVAKPKTVSVAAASCHSRTSPKDDAAAATADDDVQHFAANRTHRTEKHITY